MTRLAPEGALPIGRDWFRDQNNAKVLAEENSADILAMAWRMAMEREATGHDKFNLGHLKP